jgi:hypothetical protein
MGTKPSGAKSDQRFRDRIEAMPSPQQTKPAPSVLTVRFMPLRSSSHSTIGSRSEIPDVQAAKIRSTKNRVPNREPMGI